MDEKKSMDEKIARLVQYFDSTGEWKRGINTRIAKETGFSPSYVGQVFSSIRVPADKFIKAVCTAYSISKEWVDTGHKPRLHRRGLWFPQDAPEHPDANKKVPYNSDNINAIEGIIEGLTLTDITDPIIAETISEMLKMPRSKRYRVLATAVELNENSDVVGQ